MIIRRGVYRAQTTQERESAWTGLEPGLSLLGVPSPPATSDIINDLKVKVATADGKHFYVPTNLSQKFRQALVETSGLFDPKARHSACRISLTVGYINLASDHTHAEIDDYEGRLVITRFRSFADLTAASLQEKEARRRALLAGKGGE